MFRLEKPFLFFNYSKLLQFTVKNTYFAYCGMLHIPLAVIPNTRNMEI